MTICDRCGNRSSLRVQEVCVMADCNAKKRKVFDGGVDLCEKCLDLLNTVVTNFLTTKAPEMP